TRVLDDGARARIAEPRVIRAPMGIPDHSATGPIDAREATAEGSHPELAATVFVQTHDAARGETRRALALGANRATRGIEPLQASGNRADPQRAAAVPVQRHHPIVSQLQRP